MAELAFVDSEPGSLVIDFVLRNADPTLLATQARTLGIAVAALVAGAQGSVPEDVQREDATHLLQAVEDLCPSTFDDYQIDVRFGGADRPKVVLTSDTRRLIHERIKADEAAMLDDEPDITYGVLVQINTGKGEDKIVIRAPRFLGDGGGIEIDCYYPNYLRDQVANMVGGSLVEVIGFTTRASDGNISKFREVIALEMVDTQPIRLRTLEHDGTRFTFVNPFSFDVEFSGGIWAYSNELLNVSGFAESRQLALRELAEAMSYVWREFAMADESELDAKAIELKRRLVASVTTAPLARGVS
ncbi:MAG: hypothetical protein HEQ23_13565 [Tepidisphaera sp.]